MLVSADRDVTELSAVLAARVKQAEAIRSRWFRLLTATSLAIIAGATLGKVAVEGIPVAWITGLNDLATRTFGHAAWMVKVAHWFGIGRSDVGHVVEFLFAVLFGLCAWLWSEGAEVDKDMKDELTAHSGLDWYEQ